MGRLFYFIISAFLVGLTSSCGQQLQLQEPQDEESLVRIAVEPEFDELQVEVKSIEIGKTDIFCYAFTSFGPIEGYPKKQTEIQGNRYYFDVPTSHNLLAFVVYPEDVIPNWHYTYSSYYINDYYIYYEGNSNGSKTTLVHEYSEVTCTKREYYIGDQEGWWSRVWSYSIDEDTSYGKTVFQNMQRDCKLMLNFTGMPEGETAETYVDKIYVKVGGMDLDKVLTMADLTAETVEEETLWCKTIYTVMGYDLFGEGFRTMDIIIETTDGKIYVTDQFKYNYERNEQQRININFAK